MGSEFSLIGAFFFDYFFGSEYFGFKGFSKQDKLVSVWPVCLQTEQVGFFEGFWESFFVLVVCGLLVFGSPD